MDRIFAERLHKGDEIRVIAPSCSLSYVRGDVLEKALAFLAEQGYKITFSEHAREIDEVNSSSVKSRLDDLHAAFSDSNVKAVMSCIGGFNVNQLLEYIDYGLIAANPKILMGYSDITALLNAVYAKTGLVTYHAPQLCSYGFDNNLAYTYNMAEKCVCENAPYEMTPSSGEYFCVHEGEAEGEIIGGNLCTLNLLQGTSFMPDLTDKILFIEDDNIMGDFFSAEFERNLQSLLQVKNADKIKGVVFGRFDESCKMETHTIERIVSGKTQLDGKPIIFNADFGHILPIAAFPIGGTAKIISRRGGVKITITKH